MAGWVKAKFTAPEKQVYTYEPHRPAKVVSCIPWMVCSRCGLVYLKNAATAWCVQKGCNAADHLGYQAAIRDLR